MREDGKLDYLELPAADLPPDPDPRLARVTVGNLLSMQAGLGRQSGPNYGRWVSSGNWVRTALAACPALAALALGIDPTASEHLAGQPQLASSTASRVAVTRTTV